MKSKFKVGDRVRHVKHRFEGTVSSVSESDPEKFGYSYAVDGFSQQGLVTCVLHKEHELEAVE